ncbi:RNA-directed DNA polymerase (reverse transcriptase)-related family protein [Rhynchospora pubera]|uniref:RNA-directed DNA polymerase (Reverse transcriptase)-related family protein n=1 Tax=Rhynchospora pubera TaxID=906938 RepID=A0AAV8F0H0_9POAL|nr:RNA-directed DNA polymerase (reverse transcriptase)-related family protein [Rhynchospora pubera]
MGSPSFDLPEVQWNMLYPVSQAHDLSNLDFPISIEEVKQVISSWPSSKSPGPDGFTGDFYKCFCEELAPEIVVVLNSALQSNSLQPLNTSLIALIPKFDEASVPADFRPISIVHSIQRILSKIMTLRLTPFLQFIVTVNQTGFLQQRSIIDNFLYAQEVISHAAKANAPLAVFKADVHKAFDTLSWSFISKVFSALHFSQSFINKMVGCILSGSSRVVINGIAGKPVILKRGVRQGDPMSPYIFIIAFDFLSRWIAKLNATGAIPVSIPGMHSSLYFADDAMLFFKPTLQQATFFKLIFASFAKASGLCLNSAKSDLATLNCTDTVTHSLASLLGCRIKNFPLRYLGLPLSHKSLSALDYDLLLSKFRAKLQGWAASLLSIAGRLVLINSCLSSLPTYFMSVFKLPLWVIKKIDAIRRSFLWHGSVAAKRKLIFVDWKLVTKPKNVGGLGILDLSAFNIALLTKWLWKWSVHSHSSSLWKSLSSKLQDDLLSLYPLNSKLTPILRHCKWFLNTGLVYTVGSGKFTLFWHHNWASFIFKFAYQELYSFVEDKNISVFTFAANLHNPLPLFLPVIYSSTVAMSQLAMMINFIYPLLANLHEQSVDSVGWKLHAAKGIFSTSSVYNLIKCFPSPASPLSVLWKFRIPPRFKIFIWQMCQNKIATVDNLQKRGWNMVNRCCLCKIECETVSHLFNHCVFFISLKEALLSDPLVRNVSADSAIPTVHSSILTAIQIKAPVKDIFAITFFVLWRERCKRVFTGVEKSHSELLPEIFLEWRALKKL